MVVRNRVGRKEEGKEVNRATYYCVVDARSLPCYRHHSVCVLAAGAYAETAQERKPPKGTKAIKMYTHTRTAQYRQTLIRLLFRHPANNVSPSRKTRLDAAAGRFSEEDTLIFSKGVGACV